MLKLKNIDVSLACNHILRNLNCEVQAGDFIVIVGGNGAGKTTFFDTIAGKIRPQHGAIKLDGEDVTNFSEQDRAKMVTRIFQDTNLNSVGNLTVAQNLAIALYSRRKARLVDGMQVMPHYKAIDIITNLGLGPEILNKKMHNLSGGQRQLIAFAMSTQLIPKILLLDEPTAALDPQAATTLLQYAAKFIKQHRITTLLITHDPQIALNLGNKIWVLERGQIVKQYTQNEKKDLSPNQLIGQINYAQLAS